MMPTANYAAPYRAFVLQREDTDRLFADESGSLYWAQGPKADADVLIPVSADEFARAMLNFMRQNNISPANAQPLSIAVEWGNIQLSENEQLWASSYHFSDFSIANPGEAIRKLRNEAGLSQAKLAQAAGVDPKTISLLELNKVQTITPKTAALLIKFFSKRLNRKVSLSELGYELRGSSHV